jgi:phage/plasmid-like protein (TIGR03299 family)
MAHMIEENQIAYVGETPWHGLGVQVEAGTTGSQMLSAAGLDWKVEKRTLAVKSGRSFQTEPIKGFKAIVRSDTGRVFTLATPKYESVQNKEIVDFFREYCEAGHATMETVGGLKGGAVVWALAKLNGGERNIGGIDPVKGYMLLATSHDSSLCTLGRATQVRVVCNNTLSAALASKAGKQSFRMLHNTKWTKERRAEAQKVMGLAIEQVDATNTLSEELARVTIDERGWLEFMGKLLGGEQNVIDPKKAELTRTARMIQDATLDSPGAALTTAAGTLWGAVNGVSYYADHQRGFSTTTNDSRMTAAWFGQGASLKAKAVEVAREMAGLELVNA